MTQPAPAPPPAPPVPVPTPPAAATPAPAAEAPKPAAGARPSVRHLNGRVTKTYNSRPAAAHVPAPAPAAAAPPAPAASAATSQPASAPVPPPAAPPLASGSTPKADADSGAAADPAKPPAPPVLDAAEEAKRMARINRAEARVNEERQRFAQEKQQHQQALQRVAIVEQAAQVVGQDPIAFLTRSFGDAPLRAMGAKFRENPGAFLNQLGVSDQEVLQFYLDGKVKAPPPPDPRVEAEKLIAGYREEVQAAREQQKRDSVARDIEAHKSNAILPVLSDATKYELTHRYFGGDLRKAADEVFALQSERWKATAEEVKAGRRQAPEALTPQQAADLIEKHLRSQRDLLAGANVAPGQSQPTARQEPAPVQPSGSKTATYPSYKPPPKAYQVKAKR